MKITVSKKTFILLGYVLLMCLGSIIKTPFFTIQSVLMMAAGMIFGAMDGTAVMGLFLMFGAFGFPIFDGGFGGFAFLVESKEGYRFISAFFAAMVAGIIAKEPSVNTVHKKLIMAACASLIITEIPPILHSTRVLQQSPTEFLETLEPRQMILIFIVKVILATALAKICRPLMGKISESK